MPDSVFKFVHPLYYDTTASVQNVLYTLITAMLTWSCWSAFYNVYLHPLARFPGPKLAAASKYWLFYQEFVRGVSLSDVRDELHAQYGASRFLQAAPLLATLSTRHSPLIYGTFRLSQVTSFECNPIWCVGGNCAFPGGLRMFNLCIR